MPVAPPKALSMISYAIDVKSQQICEKLGVKNVDRIRSMLTKFISLTCESFGEFTQYLPRVNFKLGFEFDAMSYSKNNDADDKIISSYLDTKNQAWEKRADTADIYDESINLKVSKFQKSMWLNFSLETLKEIFTKYLVNDLKIHDGTILNMLMHFKYIKPVIMIDINGFNSLQMRDQVKLVRGMNKLELN